MSDAVVVASYNRPGHIVECVRHLISKVEGGFAIVVVDDGSAEPYAPLLAQFAGRVTCLRQANAGPAAARNLGVAASRADFVAFTDDDCRPRPGWFAALKAAHRNHRDILVGGPVVNSLADNVYAQASQDLSTYLYGYFGEAHELAFFTTNNLGFSRTTFERLGGLDPYFSFASEDRDLSLRWRSAGGRLVYVPEAVVDHRHALGLARFLRQHMSYGRGARRLHLKMERAGDARPKIEPFRFYRDLMLDPVKRDGVRGLPRSVLLALSQVAMVAGYAAEVRRRDGAAAREVEVGL